MNNFRFYNKKDVLSLVKVRRFETKVGEMLDVIADANKWQKEIEDSPADYVLFGIPEDIGVLANHGIGGANTAWVAFLQSFLNTQSNDFFEGSEVLLLGHFDFDDMKNIIISNTANNDERIAALRNAVNEIDEQVSELVKTITKCGKMPIAIGGGHNNAYGMIKGAAKGLQKMGLIPVPQINCINVDAHADYRPTEGRHSGNAFRYAEEDGFLNKYCVIGLHENYIQQNVWNDFVNNPTNDLITYEDIFIHEKRNFIQAIVHACSFTDDSFVGIELDLDCIENIHSSAMTPCGIKTNDARQYLSFTAQNAKCAYLHICEGIQAEGSYTGKLISYLVTDFVKSHSEIGHSNM